MKITKIKGKSFNLDALKGMSKTKFTKGHGTEEEYLKIEKLIKTKKKEEK